MTPPFAIGIPWRPGLPERTPLHDYVVRRLKRDFPGVPVVDFDSRHTRFNRAASRNRAVAALANFPVVMLCDADTFPEVAPTRAAVREALNDGKVHRPFTRFHPLSREATQKLLMRGVHNKKDRDHGCRGTAPGGVIITSPDVWWRAGGMDERFTGWGYEDTAFQLAARELVGVKSHPGTIWHLWHPWERHRDSPEFRHNETLNRHYLSRVRNPQAMRTLVSDPRRITPITGEDTGSAGAEETAP